MVSNASEGDGHFGWSSGDSGEADDEHRRYPAIPQLCPSQGVMTLPLNAQRDARDEWELTFLTTGRTQGFALLSRYAPMPCGKVSSASYVSEEQVQAGGEGGCMRTRSTLSGLWSAL